MASSADVKLFGKWCVPRARTARIRARAANARLRRVARAGASLASGRRTFDGVECPDLALEDHIAVKAQHATYLPHTAGRYQTVRFRKGQVRRRQGCPPTPHRPL